jgi:hypothetical protein
MRTALVLCALAAAVVVASAAADGGQGPSPGVDQGGEGVLAPSGWVRYVALPTQSATIVEVVRVHRGLVWNFRIFKGHYGIPYVTTLGQHGGLSRDGKLLVLSDGVCCGGLRRTSHFLVLGTRRLQIRQRIALHGDFMFDALSPDATTLYVIQHTSASDFLRYRVRAYDLQAGRLLPGVIADRTEPKEVMHGYPLRRVTGPGGAWVYTLYAGGKMAFVHALDTVHRRAVCLGLPWKGSQSSLWTMRLRLSPDGKKLVLAGKRRTMEVALPS